MKYDIHQTSAVPYIIAERAAWNVLEQKYKDLTPEQCAKTVQGIAPKLIERAEIVYSNNEHFRKQMNHKKTDQRYFLEMFMEHWALGLLDKDKIKNYL